MILSAALAAILVGVAIDSGPRPITQLVHTSWTAKDGAPNGARALAQTADGYLWIGTLTGLVRFDGVRFVPLSMPSGEAVPSGGVRKLLATRDSALWIVWRAGGVSQLRNGRLTTFRPDSVHPAIRDLAESATGDLVGGTPQGLVRFTSGRWEDVTRSWAYPGTESQAVWFDRDATLWAQTEDRVVYRPAGSSQFLDPGMRLSGLSVKTEFAQARDGTIWMAEVQRSAHTVRRIGDTAPLTEVLVGAWTLELDQNESLWIGTVGDGLRRVRDPSSIRGRRVAQFGTEAEHFTVRNGLLSDVILAILSDREGNVWVASDKGLERFHEGPFVPRLTTWPGRPHTVYALRDSSIWAAAYSGKGFLRFGPGIGNGTLTADSSSFYNLYQDAAGQLWSVSGPSLRRLQGEYFAPVPLRKGNVGNLQDVTTDKSGTLWTFDHQLGLFRLERDSLMLVAPLGPAGQPHTYLLADRQERIWAAQESRIIRYDRGQVQVYPASQDGAPLSVNGIVEDRGGQIWTFGEAGLQRFEGDRFKPLHTRQAVPGRWVLGAAIDDDGAWWLATPVGVVRLPPGEPDRAIADTAYTLRYRAFDGRDGVPGAFAPTFRGPLVTRSADGRIWIGTENGVASIDPRALTADSPPPVLIEVLRVKGAERLPTADLQLPSAVRDLEIDFTSTSLTRPDRVNFRYQLEGEEREWHDVGTRRRAYYSRLGPGTYRFRVAARNADGDWDPTGAVLSFRVRSAWYETLWFRTGIVLLIATLGAGTAALVQQRRHLREQRALSRQFDERLAERTRIARELHDTLLQTVQGSKIVTDDALDRAEDPERMRRAMTQVSGWLGQAVDEGRAALNSLRGPSTESDLAQALRRAADNAIRPPGLTISVYTLGEPRRLHPAVHGEVYLIGQEGIRNACRHSRATTLAIVLEFHEDVVLRMTDDGVGVAIDANDTKPGHFGIAGMRERATAIGGTLSVEPATPGTRITLVVPGRSAFLT